MISEIERLQSAIDGSAELRQGIESTGNPDELVKYAGGKGYNFSVAELEQWGSKNPKVTGELSSADLDGVVGGTNVIGWAFGTYYDLKHALLGHY
jgi:predicted ribosomally synthesized peptide with nif11-like leader